MLTPAAIVYQGQRYVRADTPHPRCKPDPTTGTLNHWNEKRQKCMPVDRKTGLAMTQAHARTGDANRASRHANPAHLIGATPDAAYSAKKHYHAAKRHHQAAETHQQVALMLHDQGFHELATKHREQEHQHQAHEAAHQRGEIVNV